MTLLVTRRPDNVGTPPGGRAAGRRSLLWVAAAHPDRAAAILAPHGRAGRSHRGPQVVVRFDFTDPAAWPTA